jgi:hypothetical protein
MFQETRVKSLVRSNFRALIRCFDQSASGVVLLDMESKFPHCHAYLNGSIHTTKRQYSLLGFGFVKFNVEFGNHNLFSPPNVTGAVKSWRMD